MRTERDDIQQLLDEAYEMERVTNWTVLGMLLVLGATIVGMVLFGG